MKGLLVVILIGSKLLRVISAVKEGCQPVEMVEAHAAGFVPSGSFLIAVLPRSSKVPACSSWPAF